MILEAIFDLLFMVLDFVMGLLPFFDIPVDYTALTDFIGIVKSVSYFLPMDTIGTLFGITIAVMSFRIIVSVVKTIWELIPLL